MNNLQLVSVIAVIRNQDGKYLLVQREKDDDIYPLKWQNLGGKVEPGERLEEALKREILEEVGIAIKENFQPEFLMSYAWKKSEEDPIRLGVIFKLTLEGILAIKICDELNSFGWFTYEEVKELDTIAKSSPTGTCAQICEAQNRVKISRI